MSEENKQKSEEEKEEEKKIEQLIIEYDTPNPENPEKLFLETYAKIKRIATHLELDGDITEATTLLLDLLEAINKHKQLKGEKNRRLAIISFALALSNSNYITTVDDLVFLLEVVEKLYGFYPKGDKNVTDRL